MKCFYNFFKHSSVSKWRLFKFSISRSFLSSSVFQCVSFAWNPPFVFLIRPRFKRWLINLWIILVSQSTCLRISESFFAPRIIVAWTVCSIGVVMAEINELRVRRLWSVSFPWVKYHCEWAVHWFLWVLIIMIVSVRSVRQECICEWYQDHLAVYVIFWEC